MTDEQAMVEAFHRKFGILVQTAPTVTYEILMTDGTTKRIDAPSELPNLTHVEEIREPYILMNLILPSESVGGIIQLCERADDHIYPLVPLQSAEIEKVRL